MLSTGETLRQIRQSKGLTLKEVASDQLSVAFLSKVERGDSDISLGRFENLLERLRTTYDEFSFIKHNLTLSPQITFWRQVATFVRSHNVYGLQRLYTAEKDLAANSQSPHFHNMIILHCHLCRLQSRQLPVAEVKVLHDFLFTIDSWGGYELGVFTHAMFLFPTDELQALTQTALKKSQVYLDLPGYHDLLATLLGNALAQLLTHHQWAAAQRISVQAQHLIDFEDLSTEKSQILLLTAWLNQQHATGAITVPPETVIQACYDLAAPNWSNTLYEQLTTLNHSHA